MEERIVYVDQTFQREAIFPQTLETPTPQLADIGIKLCLLRDSASRPGGEKSPSEFARIAELTISHAHRRPLAVLRVF
jgi:hypothetical protein